MSPKMKITLIIAIFLSLLIIPKIAFSSNDLYDSFNYSNTALAQTAINEEGIEFYPYDNGGNSINRHANGWSVRWAVTSSIASLSLVTGLSPRELQSLPICAIGIMIMAYLVASKLTKDWRFAALYTLMLAFDPTVNSLTNGTYIQGWGFIFYFMLIYTTMVVIERKYYLALIKRKEHYNSFLLYGSLIVCSLFMMYYTYYSTLVYAAILLAVVAGGILLTNSGKSLNRKHVTVFLILLIIGFTALYFAEATVRFALSNFQGLISTSFNYAMDVILAGGSRFYVGLLSYILIFLPLCILGYRWLRLLVANRKIPMMTSSDYLITAFLATGFVNIVIYTGLGLVDFKYFIMFFSLCALYAILRLRTMEFKWHRPSIRKLPLRQIFSIALTILFILKFVTYIAPVMVEHSVDERSGETWLSLYCLNTGTNCISDLRLSGDIMLMYTEIGTSNFNSVIYSEYYLTGLTTGNLTEFHRVNGNIDYLILTEGNMGGHFNIGNWDTWTSEYNMSEIVGYRTTIMKIYSSPNMSVWSING